MTNKRKVYTKIMQKLKKMMPQTPQNQMVTTAIMVTGIVFGSKETGSICKGIDTEEG